jgi:hypothetical protein
MPSWAKPAAKLTERLIEPDVAEHDEHPHTPLSIGVIAPYRAQNVGMTRARQVAAGGRFVHAVQPSVFCGVVGLCEGGGGLSHGA